MSRHYLIFLFAVLSSLATRAQSTVVNDPSMLLNKVDAFVGSASFDTSLKCDSQARFYAPVQKADLNCDDPNGCSASYQLAETAEGNSWIGNCSPDAVSIYSDSGQILDITRSDFEANHGNMARLFLANVSNVLGAPGEVTVQSLTPASYTLASGAKLEAMHVQSTFRLTGASRTFALLITVVKDTPGVAQIARLRLDDQTWFRLKEF